MDLFFAVFFYVVFGVIVVRWVGVKSGLEVTHVFDVMYAGIFTLLWPLVAVLSLVCYLLWDGWVWK